jgi:hypothetical protein
MHRPSVFVFAGALLILIACSSERASDPPVETPSTPSTPGTPAAAATVGAMGGTVAGDNLTLTIPPGALASEQTITVTATNDSVPSEYEGVSRMYQFAPDGIVFMKPVQIRFTNAGDPTGVVLVWSKQGAPGYDEIATTSTATSVLGFITHFSHGFLARHPPKKDAGADATTDATTDAGPACSGACAPADCCNDTCVDRSTSNTNCGACGNTCSGGQTCQGGTCTCPAGDTNCSGICVNLQTSNVDCGACGNACTMGKNCQGGQCLSGGCTAPLVFCGTCVDTSNDTSNCGACFHFCSSTEVCSGGQCVPSQGL